MAKNRTQFDWSILDRQGLIDILWLIYPDIVDKKITPSKFRSIVSKHLKQCLPIRIKTKQDASVDSGWIYIGGCYYSYYDQENKKSIEVLFNYNPFDEYVIISNARFKKMCKTFADVVLHEIMHMRQYRRRNYKVLPDYESQAEKTDLRKEQNYLGCSDEIDAYSFNIACELLEKLRKPNNVQEYVSKKHQKGRLLSHSLRSYLRAFEYNHNHPIIKRLKKRIIRYIPNAQLGKPYRTSDWINR